eukprot:516065_1
MSSLKLKDEHIVYGYCRELLLQKVQIPIEIFKLCLLWYHIPFEVIKFTYYSPTVTTMFNNNTEWKSHSSLLKLTNQMVSADVGHDVGYNTGVHQWRIHCINSSDNSYQAIGVVSNKRDKSSMSGWFNDNDIEFSYYWYGYDNYRINTFNNQSRDHRVANADSWDSGDKLIVILDCEKWTITFKKNDQLMGSAPINIEPNHTYYPTVASCGISDHYKVDL